MHLQKEKRAFSKAASLPARRQSENAGPSLFGFRFSTLPPHLECCLRFFPLGAKEAFAKVASDTLREAFARTPWSVRDCPKHLLRLFLASKVILFFF